MISSIRTGLQWLIIFPFTTGNDVPLEGKFYSDGRFSAVVLASFFISTSGVFIILHAEELLENSISLQTVKYFLLSFLALGVLVALVKSCLIWCGPETMWMSNGLKSKDIIIILFGILSIGKITFDLFLDFDCILSKSQGYQSLHADIAFNCCLFCFNSLQMFILIHYLHSDRNPPDSLKINYSLMVLFAANASVWFFSLLFQSWSVYNWIAIGNVTGAIELSSASCARLNISAGNKGLDIAYQFLNPFNVGFSLAAVGVIAGIWNKIGILQDGADADVMPPDNHAADDIFRRSEEVGYRHRIARCIFPVMCLAAFVILLINIIYMLMLILDIPFDGDKALFLYITNYGHKITMLLFILVTYYTLCQQTTLTHPKSLQSEEIIFVLSCTGLFAYEEFRMIASLFCDFSTKNISSEALNGDKFDTVVLIISDFYQTTFILQAKRCSTYRRHRYFISIEKMCFMMSILNVGTWAIDIMGEFRYNQITPVQAVCYGPDFWSNAKRVLSPFIIFYRLKCFMLFYELYKKFKDGHNRRVRQDYETI